LSAYPLPASSSFLFSYPATPPPATYTLSLHDALPISRTPHPTCAATAGFAALSGELSVNMRTMRISAVSQGPCFAARSALKPLRSEEHTFELQSLAYLVCRLLLEKKKKKKQKTLYKNK